jgi:fibronectin-binding autotransporter adhesin
MSLNKQQLEAVNQANFPDNNSKFITPELLREFNTDMIDAIQLTGSYATTGSNTFVGNQTITGNLSVSGVISASVLYVQTETASVIYSSGSNQLGDELTDIQTLSGSVKIQGQLLINGVPLTSGSTTNTGSLVTTASFNAYTQSTNLRLNSLETNSASVNVSISNLNGTTASLNTSVTALNQFTQSQAALNGTFATTGSNTFTGNQIIDRASKLYTNGIYWTDVTAGFNNLEIINQGGGNLDFASLNGGRMRVVNTPLVLTGSALSSNSDISTSANVYGANLTASAIPAGTISSSAQITSLGFVSSSVTASSLITASFSGNTLTFTKGDASTFGVVIPDVSGSTINTGSFATTGSNTFTGNNTFNDNVYITASRELFFGNQSSIRRDLNGTTVFDTYGGYQKRNFTSGEVYLWQQANALLTIENQAGNEIHISGSATKIQDVDFIPFSASVNSRLTGFATTGSNSFNGNQTISGSLTISSSASNDLRVEGRILITGSTTFTPQLRIEGNDGGFTIIGRGGNNINTTQVNGVLDAFGQIYANTSSVAGMYMGVYDDPNFNTDVEVAIIVSNSGSTFNDWDNGSTFSYVPFMTLTPNTGNNPIPIMTRGLGISGSLYVSGNIYANNLTGSTINTGSFATTGSNQFYGDQTINGGALRATAIYGPTLGSGTGSPIKFTSTTIMDTEVPGQPANLIVSGAVNVSSSFTASLQEGYVWVGNSSGRTVTVPTSSFGGGGSTNTGSLMVTGSIAGNILTFTKGDASTFNLIIPSASGSVFDTGSFATTGSNTFYGNQTIASGSFTMPNGFNISAPSGQITNLAASNTIQFITEGAAGPGGTNDIKFINRVSGSKIIFENTQGGQGNTIEFTAGAVSFDIGARSGSTGKVTFGSNTTSIEALSTQILAQRLVLSGPLTASLQQGYAWVGGAGDVSTLVATSSFGSGGTGFATTGSNTFTGDQTLIDNTGNFFTISDASGSMMLVAKGSTSASLHLSASSAGIGNIIFKTNSNTADTIISGSSNLFVNATAPTTGFKRYVGGSGNIMLNASNVPQISGSMAFSPTMNNNYFGGNSTTLIMRGPVSSSTYTISGNSILGTVSLGSSAANHAQGLVSGVTMTANEIPGTLTVIANKSNLSSSLSFISNIFNGALALNVNSSSVVMTNNNINDGGFTLNNNFFSGSAGVGSVTIAGNNIGGAANTITIQGTQPAGTNNTIFVNANTILGGQNTLFVDPTNTTVSGTNAYHSANRNIIGGNNLIVSASSFGTDFNSLGSAYFGRYNANDGIRNKTSDVVFAVGTGNSTTRKTGFLIDSGSNSFFEGSVNVSGSLLLNGTPITSISTGSFATTGSNTFVGNQLVNNGALQVASYNETTPQFYGPVVFQGVGTASVAYDQFVNAGNFDSLHIESNLNAGTIFQDYNGSSVNTWLSIPTNTGNNPAPIMPRGLNVTGGGNVATTGSNVFTGENQFNNQIRYVGGSDNLATTQLINSQTLLTKNVSISSGNNSGSFQQLSMSTGSGGNTSFQMQATLSGSTADLSIFNLAGATSARILADDIVIAKSIGFPNIPANNVTIASTNLDLNGGVEVSGSLTIQSGSSFFANGNKQFNVGAFQSNVTQSGSANVSQSMNFEVTDISSGVSIASNSRITLANSGTYNIQFSAQVLADTGADDVYIWLKKNGTNVSASAGKVTLANNEELIAAWNYVVDAAASDYFEIVWQSTNGDAVLLSETATGNIPSIPSIILTVTQVR